MALIEQLLQETESGKKSLVAQELLTEVSEAIWGAMEGSGVTLVELAERCGYSKSDLSQKLSGRRNLTLRTLSEIADALGLAAKIVLEPKHEAWEDAGFAPAASHRSSAIPCDEDFVTFSERWSPERKTGS